MGDSVCVAGASPDRLEAEHGLLSAALEHAGVALEIKTRGGERLFATSGGRELFKQDADDASPTEERAHEGHTLFVERMNFEFNGAGYRVAAAMNVDAQRRMQDELYQRAYFDPLTQLPNRELCDRAVADLVSAGEGATAFALALIEIEKFTQINAVHGETAGDELLQRIAERIGRALRSDEWLGRCGGDEFCVILAGPPESDVYRERIGELVARLADPYLVAGAEVFASAKAGLSVWPQDDKTPEGLWRKARAALSDARREAGARVRAFDPEMQRAQLRRGRLEMNLRSALRDRRVACAFQPKFDFRAGVVDSLEALMRWRDDDGQWHAPGEFLDVAHRVGLTNDITQIVLETVIESFDDIALHFRPGLHVGFNIAARQAGDARFMRHFAEQLAESGFAQRFTLELTEEAFLPATQFQSRVLPMLREIGARISIDDFGAGFSSLAMLADITADELKVDRSLIADIDTKPRSQMLLRAIESMGEALNMEIVVEGVETEAELAFLREHTRIRIAQGYLVGRPVMLDRVERKTSGNLSPRAFSAQRSRPASGLRVVERRQS